MPDDKDKVATPETGKDSQEPQQIPYARFKEKIDEANGLKGQLGELQKQMAALQAATQKQETDKLAEQGKFKDLFEQQKAEVEKLKGHETKLSAYAEKLKGLNELKKQSIPENFRDLIPAFTDPMDEFDYLVKFESKLPDLQKSPGAAPAGGKPGGGGEPANEIKQLEDQLKALDGKYDQISGAQRVALTNKIHQLKTQR